MAKSQTTLGCGLLQGRVATQVQAIGDPVRLHTKLVCFPGSLTQESK